MKKQIKKSISRRDFFNTIVTSSIGLGLAPYINCGKVGVSHPMKRTFGQIDFDVTTFGLGGQGSLQWTPEDVDPVNIILKAFDLGINYYDTSNLYGPSQLNFGKAFRELNLIPGKSGYNETLRRSIFLTSKTGLRWANGSWEIKNGRNISNGPKELGAVGDLKRTLSHVFGDGKDYYPPGAYLDMVLIHVVNTFDEIDVVFSGLDNPDAKNEDLGALPALVDFRDGTNITGLNSKEEKLIRHIGFSGHQSPAVLMEMIQRDEKNIFQAMLVTLNANDRISFNMQYNVIPVAKAKNLGMIAMKVFADGAMYTKEARFSRTSDDVVRTVGSVKLPSRPLIQYPLTTPGISTAIIGIGHVDINPKVCQLKQNLSAAQITMNGLSETERQDVEKKAMSAKEGQTNYFQQSKENLSAPREAALTQKLKDQKRIVHLSWQTAYAGDEPIKCYEIRRDDQKVTQIAHKPQINKNPFVIEDILNDKASHQYKIVTIDKMGREAATENLLAQNME